MEIIHFLDDIDLPISCSDWGNTGSIGIPPIVDDGSGYTIFKWFENPNGPGVFPLIIFIDHTLEIVNIMGTSPSLHSANIIIEAMLNALPVVVEGCIDESACNYNCGAIVDDGSCEYAQENYNCDGVELAIDNNNYPEEFNIRNIYPNPFNSVLNISFEMSWSGCFHLNIQDIAGNHIKTLYSGFLQFGSHEMSWNAEFLPSGVYFISLKSGEKNLTKKVVLLK